MSTGLRTGDPQDVHNRWVHVPTLLRAARERAGLTQTELAGRAGTTQPAVARYEKGRAVPTFRVFDRLLAACGLELELAGAAAEVIFGRWLPLREIEVVIG